MNASPRLSLSIATGAYDRVQALRDGRVTIEGCDHTFLVAHQEQIFLRGFHSAEYDVCELSMSSYMISVSRGKNAYVAVPVFTSRLFRHSAIYINTAAGIVLPEDLAGKAMGAPEYQLTAALWCRGLLDDEYGVPPSAMRWFRGGLHQTGRVEKLTLDLPPEIKISDIGPDDTLNEMLCTGAIDALMTPRTPKAFLEGDPRVARLFPNYRTDEKAYFRKTGVVPHHACARHPTRTRRTPSLAGERGGGRFRHCEETCGRGLFGRLRSARHAALVRRRTRRDARLDGSRFLALWRRTQPQGAVNDDRLRLSPRHGEPQAATG